MIHSISIKKNLLKVLMGIFLLYIPTQLSAQEELAGIKELFSGETIDLNGELGNLSICPLNSNIIAFESFENAEFHDLWTLNINELVDYDEFKFTSPQNNPHAIYPVEGELDQYQSISTRELNWAPKYIGDKIWFVFVSSGNDGNDDIYLGNLTDKNIYIRLTSVPENDQHPRWSNDGNKIVFVSSRTGKGDLYLISNVEQIIAEYDKIKKQKRTEIIDFSNDYFQIERLTDNEDSDSYPTWSRNDNFILYQAHIKNKKESNSELFLLNLYNDELPKHIRLSKTPGINEFQPSWSPSGNKIAFYYDEEDDSGPLTTKKTFLSFFELPELNNKLAYFEPKQYHKDLGAVDKKSEYYGPLWSGDGDNLFQLKTENNTRFIVFNSTEDYSLDQGFEKVLYPQKNQKAGTIHNITAVFDGQFKKRFFFISYVDQHYSIFEGEPVGGKFSPTISIISETEEVIKHSSIFITTEINRPLYMGDAPEPTFELGASIGVEYFLPEFVKSLPLDFSLKGQLGLQYLFNQDVHRRIPLMIFEGGLQVYLNFGKIKAFVYGGTGIVEFSQKDAITNENSGLLLSFAGGLVWKLVDNIGIRPSISYKVLGNNIDMSPAYLANDSMLSFNIGFDYGF